MHCLAAGGGKISDIPSKLHQITGSCHCGRLKVRYQSPLTPKEIAVRVCQCTFCRRHGSRYTSHPQASLEIHADTEQDLNRYRFGTSTADFLMCAQCGVVVAAVCEIDNLLRAVVNTGAFDDFAFNPENVSEHDFDDEVLESRVARRQRNWIPEVTLNIN